MPEGPEIHREADQIRNAIGGKEALYLYFYHDHLKKFESQLTGRRVSSVEARGKGMIIHFEDDLHIYSHNQLYGKWMIRDAGDYPDTNRELRLEVQTKDYAALLYSASEIDVLSGEKLEQLDYLQSLGPDILHNTTTVDLIEQRATSDDFRRRSFATLLLDQHFLGGVGNYLRSEILFLTGIHPDQRPMDLREEEIQDFAQNVLLIAHRSYESGGITLDEQRVDELKKSGATRKEYRFYVFAREDQPCRICETPITKIKKSGRRLYLCTQCQGLRN